MHDPEIPVNIYDLGLIYTLDIHTDGSVAIEMTLTAPACPVDTVPGILDNWWSGYCIPVHACQSVAECPGLGESACVNRSDCQAIYEGVDCSCVGDTCSCADWLFESCEAGSEMLPASA